MENNLRNTKFKLSIMFSIIVFVTILILWISFFSFKFVYFSSAEKDVVNTYTNIIKKTWDFKVVDFFSKRMQNKVSKKFGWHRDDNFKENNKIPDNFINYINLDENNKIIWSNIRENIKVWVIEDILLESDFEKTYSQDWFLIKKFKTKNWGTFIIFNKINYSLHNYLQDIFWFIFISLLFSILIFFISKRFVDKTFIPVEQNIDEMKNFIINAGHELKTPIAAIDSNLQLLAEMKKNDPEMIEENRIELKKLNSLIDSLVNLSDIDNFKNTQKNILSEIIEEIKKEFDKKIKAKKLEVNIKIPKAIKIEANRDYLYIFLSNLIGNAVKYNKKDWKIDIEYKKWLLTIKDTWIWIKNKNINKIFNRFFKDDSSRKSEGFGIWLSLVKKISGIYKWDIKVESEEGKWSEFIVKF